MTKLTPDHPAVEAANMGIQEWLSGDGPFDDDPVRLAHDMTAVCITAALPHLESATEENLARLRDTPVGRALMAEGCRESLDAGKDGEHSTTYGSFSYQGGPIPPGTMTSRELADTEDD